MRIAIAVFVLILAAGAATANTHDNFERLPPPDFDDALSAELQLFLDAYATAYNRQDYDALLGMWDAEFQHPVYLAEEVDPPMLGWSRIRGYFNPKPGFTVLDGIRNAYSDVRANYLAEDIAIATYKLRFDIKVRRQKAMSSWDRVMAVFRRRDGQWKLAAYAEAPMAPLTMVRRMLQEQVPEDFADYIEEQRDTAKP